ncbi:MAG TPA: hypothetical protein VHZ03_33150 [Trebonia sp.]|jgi:hypothetical protein|nr:hypothetical protein [Trebonia sp.]
MHWEKARSEGLAAPAALGELLEPVDEVPELVDEAPGPLDDGLALHAASGTRAAAATMAATVRAVGGHARRGRRMTCVLSFIMPSSGTG